MNHEQATLPSRVLNAVLDFTSVWDGHTAWDIGPKLTCPESNAFADLLDALGLEDLAKDLRAGHAEYDQEGDEHYLHPEPEPTDMSGSTPGVDR